MRFWFLTCLVLAAAAFAAPKTKAAPPKKPVVIVDGSAAMVKLVTKSLGAKYVVKPANKRGGEVAFVNVTSEGKEFKFTVLNAADGAELGVISVPGTAKKPPKAFPKPKLTALLSALAKAQATATTKPSEPVKPAEPTPETKPEPQPEPAKPAEPPVEAKKEPTKKPEEEQPEPVAEEKPAEPAPEENAPSKPSAHYAFRAYVGGGIFNRNLYAIGSLTQQPRNSPHPASGAISVELSTFPGAGFTSNFLAHLGAFVSADFGANLRSRVGTPTVFTVTHSSSRIRFGAMGRIPIGDDVSFVLHAGYARHTLLTSVPEGYTLDTPDMLFNGFRGGATFRWHIAGPVEIELGSAAQYVSSLGTLKTDFPKAKAFAIDANLALSIELVEHLRLRLSGEWQRYFITLNGDASSPYQTRAVGDQYVWVSGGLQWSM